MYEKYLPRLRSNHRQEILDALYELSAEVENEPDGEIRNLLIEYIQHGDSDVREIAIRTAGIHWQLQEIYSILLRMLNGGESDQQVLYVIVNALTCFAKKQNAICGEVSYAIIKLILDQSRDPDLLSFSYLCLLHINNLISIREFASESQHLDKVKIDWKLVKNLRVKLIKFSEMSG